ncbi:MAG: 30S ribosomal protein S4 [Clostridia bacterium]|jgi:small subunit ribosomal protein S4|nr:30S ribosomal protein S4 [Clostridia bacterium]MBQ2092846.1 30S ribosomal protein S4 [Clostridia bacterium]MBQ2500202.1 30S ribosomal protein S4 [Clostridia bacterium]
MSRYTGAVCKQCRREGKKLFLKGDRCYTGKCALERRSYAPGQHGQGRKKTSEYGTQLRTKQQARRYYGVQESQFHKYFLMAEKMEGMTGENLLKLCESRLDNVVYLLGWANSRQQARQLVTHGHFKVNGRKCDIPSYLLKAGDTISIKEKSVDTNGFKVILEANGSRTVPTWLSKDNTTAKVVNLPDREQIAAPVEEHYIVEFYSK